uniref:Uncharacterized protein n=1 Tax=Oryza brachyantha TaxID=4533 RepID=J3MR78_ORYBR
GNQGETLLPFPFLDCRLRFRGNSVEKRNTLFFCLLEFSIQNFKCIRSKFPICGLIHLPSSSPAR